MAGQWGIVDELGWGSDAGCRLGDASAGPNVVGFSFLTSCSNSIIFHISQW